MKESTDLLRVFLSGHNQHLGTTYDLIEVPDEKIRNKRAVDGIASDARGRRLAIEHTRLQPYLGQMEEMHRFRSVFDPLWRDPRFRLCSHKIIVKPPAHCIPRGLDHQKIANSVASWFFRSASQFHLGVTKQCVPDLPFKLELEVFNESPCVWPEGRVFVSLPEPGGAYREPISKALSSKLPKLVSTSADRRFLILEKSDAIRGYVELCKVIDELIDSVPELQNTDEIWVANQITETAVVTSFFLRVWPDGVTERFHVIRCSTN